MVGGERGRKPSPSLFFILTLCTATLLASGYFGSTGHTPVALQAVGAVGPGFMWTLLLEMKCA